MITYKEKDKLATYILSIGLIDFNIKYKEVFPDEEISKNEFFLILRQFVDMALSKKMGLNRAQPIYDIRDGKVKRYLKKRKK